MVAVGDVPLKDHGLGVMDLIASDAVLDEAYAWLCDRRKDDSPHDDVWTLRERWADIKPRLQRSLLRGEYRCDVTRRVHTAEGVIEIWSAADALILKATALVLHKELAPVLSPRCFHLAGHGGLKSAVRAVDAARGDQTFVFRTDVHSYYDSLDHDLLYRQVREHVTDRRVLKLVWSYLRRMVCDGGEYVSVERGISLGCPLSPLMGALYLKPLDDLMERLELPYVRYMDDWVILTKTRWALRRVVQQVNTLLDNLKLEKHPDKTFIGRIDRGFDFLGYRFVAEGLRLAAQTKQRFVERATRLYEQGATASRIGECVRHWLTWVRSGGLEHVWDEFLVGWLGGPWGAIARQRPVEMYVPLFQPGIMYVPLFHEPRIPARAEFNHPKKVVPDPAYETLWCILLRTGPDGRGERSLTTRFVGWLSLTSPSCARGHGHDSLLGGGRDHQPAAGES